MSMVHRESSDARVSIWQSGLHNTILSFRVPRSLCYLDVLNVNLVLYFLQPEKHCSIFQSTEEGILESLLEKEKVEKLKNICLRKYTLL